MTPDKLNATLLDAMREKIPDGVNMANILMDILSLGKEAVYRRFRGDVPFTLSEAVIISQKLGVSLDKLTGMTFGGETLFDLNLFQMKNPVDIYYSTIENYIQVFRSVNPEKFVNLWDSSNRISLGLCMGYENLSKFHLFKWLYQQDAINCQDKNYCFDEMVFSSEVITKQKEFISIMRQYNRTNYIWDRMVFLSLVNDLKYFKEIHLISDETIQKIRKELLEVVNTIETVAAKGMFKSGIQAQIYISDINFETSYSYLESTDQNISFIKVYDLNTIISRDDRVFQSLKRWIQSLKKFSTLITQSAEMERYKFFKQQRKYINEL